MAKKKKPSNSLKQCTYYIEGMHCASCEILIEKKLLKHDGVESVDASLKTGSVNVYFKGENLLKESDLNKEFEDSGYRFSRQKFSRKKEAPLFRFAETGLQVNPAKAKKWLSASGIVLIFLIAFYLFEKSQLARYVSVDSTSSLTAFVMLGLVAATSSCAALVGGLLLSMSKQWNELYIDSDSQIEKASPHIMFHFGRLLSFAIFGGILGLIGSAISLDNPAVYAVLIIIVSLVMLLLAFQMLGVEWATKLQFKAPKSITRFAADETNFSGRFMPFLTGAATFLLPCGFTLIAQGIALASGSFVKGMLIMLAFSIGTLPILLGISFTGVKFNSKPHLTAKFNQIAGLLILFFVMYNINSQLNVLGLKSLSDIKLTTTTAETQDTPAETVDGVQKLSLVAKGFSYEATSPTQLKADVPTIIEVDNQGIQGCGKYMAARGLISGYVDLKPGINQIEVTPEKGTYKITCSMGMVPPVTVKVI